LRPSHTVRNCSRIATSLPRFTLHPTSRTCPFAPICCWSALPDADSGKPPVRFPDPAAKNLCRRLRKPPGCAQWSWGLEHRSGPHRLASRPPRVWQVFSSSARRAEWAILGRRFRRERLILILGAIVEANSRPQQHNLRWLTVDEGGVERRLTMDYDAQAGHPISHLRSAGGMQGRNLDEADRRWVGEGGFHGAADQVLVVRGRLVFFGNGRAACATQATGND
jgi:hypothetical protein